MKQHFHKKWVSVASLLFLFTILVTFGYPYKIVRGQTEVNKSSAEPKPAQPNRHASASRHLDESNNGPIYISEHTLEFIPAATAQSNTRIAALRLKGPQEVNLSLGDEPLFVKNICQYVSGMSLGDRLRWIYENFTFNTPVTQDFSVNGASNGMCGDFSRLWAKINGCDSADRSYVVGLHGLHAIAANGTADGKFHFIDPMLNMRLGHSTQAQLSMLISKSSLDRYFTPDGFHIPTGTARSYYMMAMGRTAELRDGHSSRTLLADHAKETLTLRLDWVNKQQQLLKSVSFDTPVLEALLREGQELTVSSHPVLHAGLQALQRKQGILFRRPGGTFEVNQLNVFPSSFSNGYIEQLVLVDEPVVSIELPVDVYAIELSAVPNNNSPEWPRIASEAATIRPNGRAVTIAMTEDSGVYALQPTQNVDKIYLNGLEHDLTYHLRAYFLVPSRFVSALQRHDVEELSIAPSLKSALEVASIGLVQNREFWSPDAAQNYGTTEGTINLSNEVPDGWQMTIQQEGWTPFERGNSELDQFSPDLLDHPQPAFVVTKPGETRALTFKIKRSDAPSLIKIGTLGIVSSFENSLSVSWSDDGQKFEKLYDHRPNLASSYGEAIVDAKGHTFFVRVEGHRQEKLLLNESNFVSLSHLLITPFQ